MDGSQFIPQDVKTLKRNRKLRVGVRWAGFKDFELENYRRYDPQTVFDFEGVDLYCLQRDDAENIPIPRHVKTPCINTWLDTWRVISSLDLVISSCTSVAHMAAAMGKPTWIMIPYNNEYFLWSMPGNTSPWYDSVRLFRQTKYKDWSGAFDELREAFAKWRDENISSNVRRIA